MPPLPLTPTIPDIMLEKSLLTFSLNSGLNILLKINVILLLDKYNTNMWPSIINWVNIFTSIHITISPKEKPWLSNVISMLCWILLPLHTNDFPSRSMIAKDKKLTL